MDAVADLWLPRLGLPKLDEVHRFGWRQKRAWQRALRGVKPEDLVAPITPSNLDGAGNPGSAVNGSPGTTQATASISPTAGAYVLVAVMQNRGSSTNPVTPTLAGASMTWNQEVDFLWVTTGANRKRITLFSSKSSAPGSGALTISMSSAPGGLAWSIDQFTEANALGTVVTTTADPANATSASITLAALRNSRSYAYGAWVHSAANEGMSVGSGFTQGGNSYAAGAPGCMTEWQQNVTTVNCSWTTSGQGGGVAVEIKSAIGLVAKQISAMSRSLRIR